jgi:LmeA-like phospholipid-binding
VSGRGESRSHRLAPGLALAAAGVGLALVVVALLGIVLATTVRGDGILRQLVERRMTTAVAATLDGPVRVDLGPAAVVPQLLDGRFERVRVAARSVPLEGGDARLSSLRATLRGVRLGLGQALDPISTVDLRAAGGSYEAVLDRSALARLVSFPGVRVRPGHGDLGVAVGGEQARLRVTGRGGTIVVRPLVRVPGAAPVALARVRGLPLGVRVGSVRVAPDGVHVHGVLPRPFPGAGAGPGGAAVEPGAPRR